MLGSASHYGQLLRTNFYDATANVRIPQNVGGLRYLIAVADSQNAVFELDKTNNHRATSFPVNILPLADLQVAGVSVPSSALSGFDFSVTYASPTPPPAPPLAVLGATHFTCPPTHAQHIQRHSARRRHPLQPTRRRERL